MRVPYGGSHPIAGDAQGRPRPVSFHRRGANLETPAFNVASADITNLPLTEGREGCDVNTPDEWLLTETIASYEPEALSPVDEAPCAKGELRGVA